MELSKRLTAVASFVEQGAVLADIGTDHAYLTIALVRRGGIRRADAMEAGLRQAAQVPLAAAERMTEILPLAETVIRLGNPNAVTDALVAAAMARSGVLGAVFNVRVNLAGIRDQDFRRETEARLSQLERAARDGEAAVFRLSAIAAHLN